MKCTFLIFLALILTLGLILFQNCKGGFKTIAIDRSSNEGPHDNSQGIHCGGEGYNACVVNKNSVYEKGAISLLAGPDYRGLSLKSVNLSFLDSSGRLQNETFRVLSYVGPQVSTTDGPLKFNYESDQGVALSQVTSYYYSSLARQFSKDRELSLIGQNMYIITQAPVTGWSAEDNTIYLGLNPDNQHDSGLDASILLNLVSEANIYYASQGAIYTETNSNHRDCRSEEKMCCLNEKGCSKAITMGLSLYFSSYFFREAPTVGESYSNRLTGMEDCGISRDLNKSKDLLISTAFYSCRENGYVYPMATVYASIWWNVFKKISDDSPQETERLQVFYLEHLKGLKGNFSFIDAFNSMRKLDSQDFESKFATYFRNEFLRRGIRLE